MSMGQITGGMPASFPVDMILAFSKDPDLWEKRLEEWRSGGEERDRLIEKAAKDAKIAKDSIATAEAEAKRIIAEATGVLDAARADAARIAQQAKTEMASIISAARDEAARIRDAAEDLKRDAARINDDAKSKLASASARVLQLDADHDELVEEMAACEKEKAAAQELQNLLNHRLNAIAAAAASAP